MEQVKLPVFGIVIFWDGKDRSGCTITSSMKEDETIINSTYNLGVDCIESLVLAHFSAGIDVSEPAYLEGIESAYQALGNHIEDTPTSMELLPTIEGAHYQWLQPTDHGGKVHYAGIENDDIDLSDEMYSSVEDATQVIKDNEFGWSVEDAKDFVLVRVSKTIVPQPFSDLACSKGIAKEPVKKPEAIYKATSSNELHEFNFILPESICEQRFCIVDSSYDRDKILHGVKTGVLTMPIGYKPGIDSSSICELIGGKTVASVVGQNFNYEGYLTEFE